MSEYFQYILLQAGSIHFGLRILQNFGLVVSGHFFLKNATDKNRGNLHVTIAFQE